MLIRLSVLDENNNELGLRNHEIRYDNNRFVNYKRNTNFTAICCYLYYV